MLSAMRIPIPDPNNNEACLAWFCYGLSTIVQVFWDSPDIHANLRTWLTDPLKAKALIEEAVRRVDEDDTLVLLNPHPSKPWHRTLPIPPVEALLSWVTKQPFLNTHRELFEHPRRPITLADKPRNPFKMSASSSDDHFLQQQDQQDACPPQHSTTPLTPMQQAGPPPRPMQQEFSPSTPLQPVGAPPQQLSSSTQSVRHHTFPNADGTYSPAPRPSPRAPPGGRKPHKPTIQFRRRTEDADIVVNNHFAARADEFFLHASTLSSYDVTPPRALNGKRWDGHNRFVGIIKAITVASNFGKPQKQRAVVGWANGQETDLWIYRDTAWWKDIQDGMLRFKVGTRVAIEDVKLKKIPEFNHNSRISAWPEGEGPTEEDIAEFNMCLNNLMDDYLPVCAFTRGNVNAAF